MDLSSMPRNRLALIAVAVIAAIAFLVVFMFFSRTPSVGPAITLKVWGTDQKPAMAGVISAYTAFRPNLTILYTVVPEDRYQDELMNAFATGKGPDVFMVKNRDVWKMNRLIAPATSTLIRPAQLGPLFPDAAAADLVFKNQVYALPLYMDTLALVYNRDRLDQAGIATPPATWDDFVKDIPALRSENAQGQLTSAAAGIGGTEKTVPHAADILSLLMMQNGTQMTDDSGYAKFADSTSGKSEDAFRFYLDFANAGSEAYTWNEGRPNAFESFFAGNTAMVFATNEEIKGFAQKSPFLKYGVAPMPQITGAKAVNAPEYKAFSAWVGGKNASWAWDFIIFATTNNAAAKSYADATARPAALRSVIATQTGSANLGIFAKQALTAASWQVPDYDKMKTIFSNGIIRALRGEAEPDKALKEMQVAINQNL